MKECRYCRSVYDDNLATCPNCGGNKVITEHEKMEEVILRQKEQEFRERMDNERKAQKKKFLAIVVVFLIIVLAVIGIGFYNANKPLSNGMTQNEGATILAQGIAYYESGDYEPAIECFVQLPADSKQYEDAQKTMEKAIEEYVPSILEKANKYSQNAEYEVALELLKNAQAIVPESKELKNAYDTVFGDYKVKTCAIAIAEANIFATNEDYENAIVSLNMALDKIGEDDELTAVLSVYLTSFMDTVFKNAEYYFQNEDYLYAVEYLQSKQHYFEGNTEYQERIDYYKSKKPIKLGELTEYESSRTWSVKYSPEGNDALGNSYTDVYQNHGSSLGLAPGAAWAEYYINSGYSSISGSIGYVSSSGKGYIQILSDREVIYTSPMVDGRSSAVPFEVDITDVEFLAIQVRGEGETAQSGWYCNNVLLIGVELTP